MWRTLTLRENVNHCRRNPTSNAFKSSFFSVWTCSEHFWGSEARFRLVMLARLAGRRPYLEVRREAVLLVDSYRETTRSHMHT